MSDAPKPAPFVVGVGRSGTTLLRLMLDAHPDLAIPPETHFLPALIDLYAEGEEPSEARLVDAVQTHAGWRDFGFSETELAETFKASGISSRAERHQAPLAPGESATVPGTVPGTGGAAGAIRAFYAAYASPHGKARWGDKTPVYIEAIAQIGSVLGDQARFVHLIRDGRDVAVSRRARAAKRGREPTPAAKEAETWKRRIEGAREQASSVAHYDEVRYEDLIADPEGTLRRVCALIDLEFSPAMLDYHRGASERLSELSDLPGKGGKVRPSSERIAAHALTSEPPTSERIERWRTDLSPTEIAEYESVAGDLLAELGYPLAGS